MRIYCFLVLLIGSIASTQAIYCRDECTTDDHCPNRQYCQTVGCSTYCTPYIGRRSIVLNTDVDLTSKTGIALQQDTTVEKRACLIYCQWGWAKDDNGHTLSCQCAPPPTDLGKRFILDCPPETVCSIFCLFGQATDDKGCILCACAHKPPSHPEAKIALAQETEVEKRFFITCINDKDCDSSCPFGQAWGDKEGCTMMCICNEAPPGTGVVVKPDTKIDGAPDTDVEKRWVCPIFCPWGLAKGAPCTCNQPPTDLDVGKRFLDHICPNLIGGLACDIYCPWGQAKDVMGCPLCACAQLDLGTLLRP